MKSMLTEFIAASIVLQMNKDTGERSKQNIVSKGPPSAPLPLVLTGRRSPQRLHPMRQLGHWHTCSGPYLVTLRAHRTQAKRYERGERGPCLPTPTQVYGILR